MLIVDAAAVRMLDLLENRNSPAAVKTIEGFVAESEREQIRNHMDELEEALSRHEILQRFKKLLGREMTPGEWQVFFLSDESTSAQEKT